jgi:hypothetical protein
MTAGASSLELLFAGILSGGSQREGHREYAESHAVLWHSSLPGRMQKKGPE